MVPSPESGPVIFLVLEQLEPFLRQLEPVLLNEDVKLLAQLDAKLLAQLELGHWFASPQTTFLVSEFCTCNVKETALAANYYFS